MLSICKYFAYVCPSHMPLTNQSNDLPNSAGDTEGSLGSHFDLLLFEVHYSSSVKFTNIYLSVPKITGSLSLTLFSFCSAKYPSPLSPEDRCLPLIT